MTGDPKVSQASLEPQEQLDPRVMLDHKEKMDHLALLGMMV